MELIRFFFLIVISTLPYATSGQSVLHYQINHVSQNEGLSSTYVRKIVQDPYGFIWAGTQDGLNRYDGRRNIIFNKDNRNRHNLSGSDIRDLIVDTIHHSIWVLTSYGGIDAIDYRTVSTWFQYDQQRNPATSDLVFNCFFSYNGSIYIGSTAGLFKLEFAPGLSPALKPAEPSIRMEKQAIDKVVLTDQFKAWMFTRDNGIFVTDMERKEVIARTDSLFKPFRTLDACVLQSGDLLAATTNGLQYLSMADTKKISGSNSRFAFLKNILSNTVFSCFQEKTGRIWASDAQNLIRINLSNETFELIKENSSSTNENWVGSVYSIFVDNRDALWLGCQPGLAFAENQVSPFYRMYQSAASLDKLEHLYYIDPDNDSLAFASGQNGLYAVNRFSGMIKNLFPGISFFHSFTDGKGNKIVSNSNGSFALKNAQLIPLEKIYTEFSGTNFVFNSHVQLNDSTIALGTRNFKGVIIWTPGKKTLKILDDHPVNGVLSENVINALYLDKGKNLWILGDRSITILNNNLNRIKSFSPFNKISKKNYSLFFDIYDSGIFFYLASYGHGVIVLNKKLEVIQEFTARRELSSNSTYKLLPYHDSLLMVSSNNGMSVIHLDSSNKFESYFENDGLHGNGFEENTGAVWNDIIYAGGTRGLSVIDPSLLRHTNATIPLFIDNLVVDLDNESKIDTININLPYFKIPSNAIESRLTFSSPVFFQSANIEYQYQIKELHEQWIDLKNRNSISFFGLAPGEYTINIRARYRFNSWPDEFLTTTLVYSPKWFQTIAFKILVLALVIGILYILYQFRITQIRKQEQVRKNIARDLHDDIGSNLNSIKIFTHLAIRDKDPQKHLINIEESLAQTSIGLRDMIWILDDSKDTVQDVVERIRRFAQPLCLAKEIEFNGKIESDTQEDLVTKSEKRNLLMIAKEVINNAIKYSNCSKLELLFIIGTRRKKLLISDNGDGFDPTLAVSGNGLKNIRHRAEQLKWRIDIQSSDNGTVVTLET